MDRLVHCNSTNQQKVLRRLCLWSSCTNHQQVFTSHPSCSFSFNSSSHVWKWELNYKESWAPKNRCFWTVVLEKTLGSFLDCKEIKRVHPKEKQSWIFTRRTDAEAKTPILWPPDAKKLTHWKTPWCWERLRAEGEGDDRGWDGWIASLTWWTWVWVSSRSWWWTGKPGVLQSMGSQRVGHNWVTELKLVPQAPPLSLILPFWQDFLWEGGISGETSLLTLPGSDHFSMPAQASSCTTCKRWLFHSNSD